MAVVHKVNERLFLITWTNAVYANEGKVEVKLNGVVQLCNFSYSVVINPTTGLYELNLKVEIVLAQDKSSSFTPLKEIAVLAIKDGVQNNMTLEDSKWTTTFSRVQRCCQLPLIIDFLLDIGSESSIMTKMNVINHINHLWNTKLLTDVTFKCQDIAFKVHSQIVASASPVLAAMFTFPDSKEDETAEGKTFEIKETIPEVFEQMLRFIYTGDVDFELADPADLFVAADKYAVDSLKKLCAKFLSENLTYENASCYLVLAHLHSSPELYQSTLGFISENAKAVCSQENWFKIIKNYPELCFAAMQLMFIK